LRAPADLLRVAPHLTDRDLQIACWLDRHGVFTTDQLAHAFFASRSTAQHRLLALYRLDWINRFHFTRPGGGHTTWHWVLGYLGAQWHAASRGEHPPTPSALHRRWAQLAASPTLNHRLGVHQLFVDLRADPALDEWWSATETAERFLQRIHPDAAGRSRSRWFFVEHDTGTERIAQVVAKLDAYTALADDGGPTWPVLFHLPNARREANLHTALERVHISVPVATTVHGRPPAKAVWHLAGGGPIPRTLAQLPSRPATNPIYPSGLQ
jgi:hypothetical protein